MILYLDASALVKRYIVEAGSEQVSSWISGADAVVTVILSRTEVPAAITKALRMGWITGAEAEMALQPFRSEWENLQRLPVNELTVARGDTLACQLGLRGSNAIHLAAALLWQEALGEAVTMATYDAHLWEAAKQVGMAVLPDSLSG